MKQSADTVPRSCLKRDRLQGPRDVGRRPSWKYRELFQLGEVALPSREGSVDGDGVLGGAVYSGRFQTGRSLRAQSQEQPLVSQGTWELEFSQGDPEPPVFPGYLCPGATPQHRP